MEQQTPGIQKNTIHPTKSVHLPICTVRKQGIGQRLLKKHELQPKTQHKQQ